jgi:hypothetical protein
MDDATLKAWLRAGMEEALAASGEYERLDDGRWRRLTAPGEPLTINEETAFENCDGCEFRVLWACHERTKTPAPLVLPTGEIKGNIRVRVNRASDDRCLWLYRVLKRNGSDAVAQPGESETLFLNHFADCRRAAMFKK